MKESILRDYFENIISANTLDKDVEGSEVKTSFDVYGTYVESIHAKEGFIIKKNHLLKLCDDTLCGDIKPANLTTIAFALIGSDYFNWDDDIIATVIFDWDNPDINYPITLDNLKKWKAFLQTGEYLLSS